MGCSPSPDKTFCELFSSVCLSKLLLAPYLIVSAFCSCNLREVAHLTTIRPTTSRPTEFTDGRTFLQSPFVTLDTCAVCSLISGHVLGTSSERRSFLNTDECREPFAWRPVALVCALVALRSYSTSFLEPATDRTTREPSPSSLFIAGFGSWAGTSSLDTGNGVRFRGCSRSFCDSGRRMWFNACWDDWLDAPVTHMCIAYLD